MIDPTADPDGTAGGSPAGEPSPPDPKAQELEELRKRLSESETANVKLREERRTERAEKLAAEHKLDKPTADLLKTLNADDMEAAAKAISEARTAAGVQAPPDPTPAPPTTEPAPAAAQATPPAPTPDPKAAAVEAMGKGGEGTPPATDPATVLSYDTRIQQAKSMQEVEAIQAEQRQKERERNQA